MNAATTNSFFITKNAMMAKKSYRGQTNRHSMNENEDTILQSKTYDEIMKNFISKFLISSSSSDIHSSTESIPSDKSDKSTSLEKILSSTTPRNSNSSNYMTRTTRNSASLTTSKPVNPIKVNISFSATPLTAETTKSTTTPTNPVDRNEHSSEKKAFAGMSIVRSMMFLFDTISYVFVRCQDRRTYHKRFY